MNVIITIEFSLSSVLPSCLLFQRGLDQHPLCEVPDRRRSQAYCLGLDQPNTPVCESNLHL